MKTIINFEIETNKDFDSDFREYLNGIIAGSRGEDRAYTEQVLNDYWNDNITDGVKFELTSFVAYKAGFEAAIGNSYSDYNRK